MTRILIAVGLVLTVATAPVFAGSGSQSGKADAKRDAEASQRVGTPKDCKDIKDATGGETQAEAARKDCQASRHLGADTGVSSGTGSGKMGSGSGPR